MATIKPSLLGSFTHGLRLAPLAVPCILIYIALPSRFIFPADFSLTELQATWHPSLAGWYDGLLLGALALTWLVYGLATERKLTVFAYLCSLAAVLSLLFGYPGVSSALLADTALFWLRWTALFCFAVWLAETGGVPALESLLVIICIVLCASALFVYRLQFGINSRIYASAMSVASFSQVVVVVLFIAITHKNYALTLFAFPFLVLTFSWTSILLLCSITGIYVVKSQAVRPAQLLITGAIFTACLSVAFYLVVHYSQFEEIRKTLTNTANAASLHGRTYIWSYGIELIRSGGVGLFGIGLNRSPLILHQPIIVMMSGNYFALDRETYAFPVHFHSILLELGVGLGVSSLLLFYLLCQRILQAFRLRCHLSWMIFSFFLLSQSLDFTFFRPKEIVLWALMLGLAEGALRLQSRSSQEASLPFADELGLVSHG
ncbi:MAG: O-antigen ligase family protein [Herpetosiphonaceae bacterium]|nr:O-antigen ligase family protein [Herpetosiphonaceae bacterium]